jgi:hypothetical protein
MREAGLRVEESIALEDEEPNNVIRARTVITLNINQFNFGLGPKIIHNLLNKELLMSKIVNPPLNLT